MNTHIYRSISNRFLFSFFFLILFVASLEAQQQKDSVDSNHHEERHIMRWKNLTPRYTKMHVAGGMGLVSLGLGWDYGKNKQWETDMLIGYIPKFSANRSSFAFTLKQNYIPWKISLNEKFIFEPLETGLYMNKVFSANFWSSEPEKYDGPYYKFATSIRFSVFLGQRINMRFRTKNPRWKSISLFYEFSTNDLYLISYVGNTKSLDLDDILILSLGLKFQIL